MAVAQGMSETQASASGSRSHDPVLEKLAKTNEIDSDWPTLRHHLHLALTASLQLFLDKGPPRSSARQASSSVPGPSNLTPTSSDDKPPADSLLLSPSHTTTSLEATSSGNPTGLEPRSVDVESSNAPSTPMSTEDHPELAASTQGGLVIPPFPPLDTSKRRRTTSMASSPKSNGHARQPPGLGDDEWDDDVVIGGKKLPAWVDEDEAKKEVDRIAKLLEDFDYAPFTVQRLAELLLEPTAIHTTIGKFLRALEKALLVTAPWEAPSYIYVPPSTTTGAGMFSSTRSSSSSASSEAGLDEESLMPPGASTPMFSPIPFLRRPDVGQPVPMDVDGPETNEGTPGDGLMSPLTLGDSPAGSDAFRFADAPAVRSPTPEPDDVSDSPTKAASSSPTAAKQSPTSPTTPTAPPTGNSSSDPGHQSYMGRVDELDTGPLQTPSNALSTGDSREDEVIAPGAGEAGNMAPHGMSDKPVALSSTTVLDEDERKIAGMPKGTLGDRFVQSEEGESGGEKAKDETTQ